MNNLVSLELKKGEQDFNRFGNDWIVPLLSLKRRSRRNSNFPTRNTFKNHKGKHNEQEHTTFFNLANPSQGRDGAGRNNTAQAENGGKSGNVMRVVSGLGSRATPATQPINSAILREEWGRQGIEEQTIRYNDLIVGAVRDDLQMDSAKELRDLALRRLTEQEKSDAKEYTTFIAGIISKQAASIIEGTPVGYFSPYTTSAPSVLAKELRTPRQNEEQFLTAAGQYTPAMEKGRLALIKSEKDVLDTMTQSRSVDKWRTAKLRKLQEDEKDERSYTARLFNETLKRKSPFPKTVDFYADQEKIAQQYLKLTPQEERGRMLLITRGRQIDEQAQADFRAWISQAGLHHNISARLLKNLLDDDQSKSFLATGLSQTNSKSQQGRPRGEHKMFGYPAPNTPNFGTPQDLASRPLYGFLGVRNGNNLKTEFIDGSYGNIRLTIKSDVSDRTTIHTGDTLVKNYAEEGKLSPSLALRTATTGDVRSLMAPPVIGKDKALQQGQGLLTNFAQARRVGHAGIPITRDDAGDRMSYMEIQVHGGIKPSRDIKEVTVMTNGREGTTGSLITASATRAGTPELKERLRDWGRNIDGREIQSKDDADKKAIKGESLSAILSVMKLGVPVTIFDIETGIRVPLSKSQSKHGLFSDKELADIMQTYKRVWGSGY